MTTPTFPGGIHDFGADVADGVQYHTAAMENEMRAEVVSLETQGQRTMLLGHFATTKTLTGTETLTDASKPVQYLDPGGADRDVTLPAEADANHVFVLANTADADELLTVKNDGGSTIGTVGEDETKLFVSDGTSWLMLAAGRSDGYMAQNTETLSANKTLTDRDAPIQFLDPGGAARDVTLPAEGNGNHPFIISNRADAAETITVKNDAAATIAEIAQDETKAVYPDGTNWAALSGGGGSGGSGDIVSELVNSEVAITAAITLTSTAFGKMHKVSGTTGNYTVTLPAASGNAGKIIGLRIAGNATKLFTIDANASEEIDGETTRVLWAGEVAILECDGTGWTKIAGKTIPMKCQIKRTSTQAIATSTIVAMQFDTEEFDVGNIGDIANNRITIRRDGIHTCAIVFSWGGSAAAIMTRGISDLLLNGKRISRQEQYATTDGRPGYSNTISQDFTAGDHITGAVYQNTGSSRNLDYINDADFDDMGPTLTVIEQIDW